MQLSRRARRQVRRMLQVIGAVAALTMAATLVLVVAL